MKRFYSKEKIIISALEGRLGKNTAEKYRVYYFDELSSTMDVASKLAPEELGWITVVIADIQSGGKGRLSRKWFSTIDDLTVSVILREYLSGIPYSLIVSYSVYRALRDYSADIYLKWVNDIYWSNGKKLGGILLEDKGDRLIIGVGINLNNQVFPEDLKGKATSYYIEKNRRIDKLAFLVDFLSVLNSDLNQLRESGPEKLLEGWENASIMPGRTVRVVTAERTYEGFCTGINKKTGFLLLRSGDEEYEIFDAERVIIRPLPPSPQ